MAKYIYEDRNWIRFTWRETEINAKFGEVGDLQGKNIGQMKINEFGNRYFFLLMYYLTEKYISKSDR